MKLYIIRHADPDYANNTITEFGHLEANALANYLKDVKIDKIFTSPLGRAKDTARPTCEVKGLDYTVLDWTAESMDYMRRINRPEELKYCFSVKDGVTGFVDFSDEDRGNTINSLIKGSDEFLKSFGLVREGGRYRVEAQDHSHVCVFCHGGFGGAWISHLLLRPPEMGWCDIRLRTSSITEFNFKDDGSGYAFPVLVTLAATPHIVLSGLRLNDR